jgi:hypothetical protein
MRKILFSALLIFVYSQIVAQDIPTKEGISTDQGQKSSNAPFKSASVLKMNFFAPLLGYSQFKGVKTPEILPILN